GARCHQRVRLHLHDLRLGFRGRRRPPRPSRSRRARSMSAHAASPTVDPATGGVVTESGFRSTRLPDVKLLMWVFLPSACMFFGSLIGTYLAYHNRSLVGPFPADVLDIPLTTVSSFE